MILLILKYKETQMAFTTEDIQALIEALKPAMVEVASKAAADHVTKRNKSFEDKFNDALTNLKPAPVEEDNEKVTLTQRVTRQEEDNRKLRDELKAEKEANQRKGMRSSLEAQLAKAGIPQNLLKAVSAQLIHEDKLVDLDKSGNAVFKVAGYNNETVSMEEGISSWLKEEGKGFIPTPQARGAGQKPVKSQHLSLNESSTQEEMDGALMEALRNAR